MKRPTKHLSDVDMRGRIRRHPSVEAPKRLIKAKFLDGPLAGTEQKVVRGADSVTIGMWTYTYAGKDGRTPLYCKQPKSRLDRRMLKFWIGKRGSDPRVQMAQGRPTPVLAGPFPHRRGQGARRRAAARDLKAAQAAWRASDGYNGR